jgi:hypothetical protein
MVLTTNLAQLPFVVHIVQTYMEYIMENRAWLTPFVEASCARLAEVRIFGTHSD